MKGIWKRKEREKIDTKEKWERQREIRGENIATAITEAEILSLWNSCSHSVTDRYMWINRDTQKPTFTHTIYFHYWLLIDFCSQRWEGNNNWQLFFVWALHIHTIAITLHGKSICYDCFVHMCWAHRDSKEHIF